jgi:autotransporter-associated beta strand protein
MHSPSATSVPDGSRNIFFGSQRTRSLGAALLAGSALCGTLLSPGSAVAQSGQAIAVDARNRPATAPVTIDSTSITTTQGQQPGIFVRSFDSQTAYAGTIIVASGSISTEGVNSSGIVVADAVRPGFGLRAARGGTDMLSIVSQSISVNGAGGMGILVDHRGPISIKSGSITTSSQNGGNAGIYVWAGDRVDIDSDRITTPNGPGIVIYGASGAVRINAASTTVGTGGDVGVFARTSTGDISIAAGTTSTARRDILNGQITADGVIGISTGGGAITIDAGTTTVAGVSAWGVAASTTGVDTIKSGTVSTSGSDGIGIYGRGDGGGVTIASQNVTTSGSNAHGIFAVSTSGSGLVDSTGTIRTSGASASGVRMRATSGALQATVATVQASGGGAHAIDLATTAGGTIDLKVRGAVTASGGGRFAGALLNGSGALAVSVDAGNSLTGSGSGLIAQAGKLVLDNAGSIIGTGVRATTSEAQEAGVRVQSTAVIRNTGLIEGREHGIVTTQLPVTDANGTTRLAWVSVDTDITNSGTIRGRTDDALAIFGGGTIRNTGVIEGLDGTTTDGIQLQWYPGVDSGRAQIGTITNSGRIAGARYGILLAGGGDITNSGRIEGDTAAVVLSNQQQSGKIGTLTNSSNIYSRDGSGVVFNLSSGTISNSGMIEAGALGIDASGSLTLENLSSGAIISAGTALQSRDEVKIVNDGAIISNGTSAIVASRGGNIDNRGTIYGAAAPSIVTDAPTILSNSGTIGQFEDFLGVRLSSGDDQVFLRTGSKIFGGISGGGGNDSVTLLGTSTQSVGSQIVERLDGFTALNVSQGYWNTGGKVGSVLGLTIAANTTLQMNSIVDAAGVLPVQAEFIRNDGRLVLNFADTVQLGTGLSSITGTGAVSLIGSGTVNVAGDVLRHSGGTSISNGALRLTGTMAGDVATSGSGSFILGDGGTSGSFTGNLVNNGSFVFARSDSYDFNGAFSGTGKLEKYGNGVLTFSGAYNFTGTTQVFGGSVILAGAVQPSAKFDVSQGTLSLAGNQTIAGLSGTSGGTVALGSGDLTINQSASSTFAGTIVGTGNLRLSGGGTLNLTGASTFTGTTTVESGVLKANGSLVSAVQLESGGTLGGNGSVGSTSANGGRIGPGNSIGQLTVAGNLTFGAGSVFEVEVDAAGRADRIDATGVTTIARTASVQVLAENGTYQPRTEYTVLTSAGGISGTFGVVTSNLAFLSPRLTYGATAVTLVLSRNDIDFAAVAATPNQAATANAVETLGADSPVFDRVLVQSADTARQSFDLLAGDIYASTSAALVSNARTVRDAMAASAPISSAQGVFPIASTKTGWGKATSVATKMESGAAVLGVGYAANGAFVGVAGTVSRSDQAAGPRAAYAAADGWGVAGVVGYGRDSLQFQAGVSATWHRVHADRRVDFGGATVQRGRYDATTRQIFGGVSYDLSNGPLDFAPFVQLAQVRVVSDGFTETGGVAALAVRRHAMETRFVTTGANVRIPVGRGTRIIGRGGWQHGWGDLDSVTDNRFVSGGNPFRIAGATLPKDAAIMDAGIEAEIGRARVRVSYAGSLASQWSDHGAQAAITLAF